MFSGTKKYNRLASVALSLLMIIGLMVPAFAAGDDASGVEITILHTNDTHGTVSGFPYLKAMKDELISAGKNVLLFDAGDTFYGQNIATLTDGRVIAELIELVGYNAITVGNDDTKNGSVRMNEIEQLLSFPVIASNYMDAKGNKVFDKDYEIFEIDGVKIGVFALTAEISENRVETINGSTSDYIDTGNNMVKEIKSAGADAIICLTHMGVGESYPNGAEMIAKNVEGIDIIIDGHSHTALSEGLTVNDTLIVQTGENFNNIGMLTITVNGTGLISAKAELISREDYMQSYEADAEVAAHVEKCEQELLEITGEVLGSTEYALDGSRPNIRSAETNLGNLVSDALREMTGADIALVPGFFIRASVEAGNITMGDVLNVLANGGDYLVYEATGEYIYYLMERSVSALPEQSGGEYGWRHVSGINVIFDSSKEPMSRVSSITLSDGSELERNTVYTFASGTSLELAEEELILIDSGDGLENFLMDYIRQGKAVITEGPVGRLVDERLFNDVDYSNWYYDSVMYVAEQGIMNGVDAGLFSGDAEVTRGMVVTTLWRMNGSPKGSTLTFTDVDADKYYTEAVAWAAENNIVSGYDNNVFGPDKTITRQEVAVIFNRYSQWLGLDISATADLSGYTDAGDIADWAYEAIQWSNGEGLINGRSATELAPKGAITRAELATMLHRLLAD